MIRFIAGAIFLLSSLTAAEPLRVLHIHPHRMDEMEDAVYASFLERALEQAAAENYAWVLLEINTPGGELTATFAIKDHILKSRVPTVCFVNSHAISAGSLVALACEKIYMAPQGVIGAAQPITINQEGMQKAPEKVVSAARAAWRATAESRGRNAAIAEAFVDENVILTKARDGLDKKAGVLLTLSATEAVRLKIADGLARTRGEIPVFRDQPVVFISASPTFREQLLSFLLHPAIAGILLGLGFLGLVIEIRTPGWGIPGSLGLLFLAIYFISRIALGLSGWGAPALFAFGFLLLLLEIFVIPGFGIAGIAGIIAVVVAILWSYGVRDLSGGLWVLTIAMLSLVLGVLLFFILLPRLAGHTSGSRAGLFLNETLDPDEDESDQRLRALQGELGRTVTTLRPSGVIQIGHRRYDAVTGGEYLEPGTPVRVTGLFQHSLLVEAAVTAKGKKKPLPNQKRRKSSSK